MHATAITLGSSQTYYTVYTGKFMQVKSYAKRLVRPTEEYYTVPKSAKEIAHSNPDMSFPVNVWPHVDL